MTNWWRSIRDRALQIKHYSTHIPKDVFVVLVIILVGIFSFGLGKISAQNASRTPVTLHNAPSADIEPMYLGGEVVASRSGSKYHFPWCAGAMAMSEKNKIWFKTVEDARRAGYTPAGNCKGLR